MSMILTGRQVGAEEAKALGIVFRVTPGGSDEVLAAAEELAAQILACSPDSIQASLQVVKRSIAEEPDVVKASKFVNYQPAAKRLFKSPNVMEGPTAFAQKRAPNWVAPVPLAK